MKDEEIKAMFNKNLDIVQGVHNARVEAANEDDDDEQYEWSGRGHMVAAAIITAAQMKIMSGDFR